MRKPLQFLAIQAVMIAIFLSGFAAVARADTKTWTGAVNNLWSTPGNWTGGVPAAGDRIAFGASGLNRTNTDDLPNGTIFYDITFLGNNYVISGNTIGLSNGIASNTAPNTISNNLQITAPQTMGGAYCCGPLNLSGTIDLGANLLTFDYQVNATGTILGSGGLAMGDVITLSGPNSYTGPTTVSQRGEIDGVQTASAVSTANFYNGTISGTGTIGPVTLNSGSSLSPGQSFGGVVGKLRSSSATFYSGSNLIAQINGTGAGVGYDQLSVAGTVTIDPAASLVPQLGFTPTLGQTFVIVDNDGTDPVAGTFNGLPEGAVISLNANELQISYAGGTGNDIVLTVTAAAKTWTGAVSNLWSNPGNWLGGVPGPGDPLVFPPSASNKTNIDDLADGMVFKLILFTGSNYLISGGAIELTNGITSNSAPNTLNTDIVILAPQTMGGAYCCGPLNLGGSISLGANLLTFNYQVNATGTISGTGGLAMGDVITLSGPNSYTGPTTISQRGEIDGVQPGSAVSGVNFYNSTISGTGTIGPVTANNSSSVSPGQAFGGAVGRLRSGSVAFGSSSNLQVQLNGTGAGVGYDQLSVTGTVTIDPSASLFTQLGFTPTLGQTFILVENDGTDPVAGTFSGLPEGAVVNLNANELQLSYVGGTGNDIVLTVVAAAKTWTGTVSNLWSNPGNWLGGVPGPGDPLVFPSSASNKTNIDDLTDGLTFKLILFTGSNYVISGNAFGLTEGITSNTAPNTINNDIQVAANQTMGGAYCCGPLNLGGNIDLGANQLTFNYQVIATGKIFGTGGLAMGDVITLAGPNIYTGPTTISQRGQIDGTQTASAVSTLPFYNATISGKGTIGPVTVNSSGNLSPGQAFGGAVGKLNTGSVAFSSNSYLTVQLNGSVPGVTYDQLNVRGAVSINSTAGLTTNLGFTPAKGQVFVIGSNDGTDPVTGSFSGLPQGATMNVGPYPFQISYIGKTGNDITLTSLSGDPLNFAPVAVDDAYSTGKDSLLSVPAPGVLANDSDPDMNPISVVLADSISSQGGIVSVSANGAFVYMPPSGFSGTDTFTYIISDGHDATDLATVTITVRPDPTGIKPEAAAFPRDFELFAPRPNPSRGAVDFAFALPSEGPVMAEVFDAAGRRVTKLANGAAYAAGLHTLAWDGRDGSGAQVGSGVYLIRLSSGSHSAIRKMVMVLR